MFDNSSHKNVQQTSRRPYSNVSSPLLDSRMISKVHTSSNLITRTIYLTRDPNDNYNHGFGICIKTGRGPGKHILILKSFGIIILFFF